MPDFSTFIGTLTNLMPVSSGKIGLSLSGGGYRAAAFHLGCLRKLRELGILSKLDIISTISGGSIAGACYCSHKDDFDSFYSELYKKLQDKDVIKKILFSWLGLRMLLIVLVLLGSFALFFTSVSWLFPLVWLFVFLLLFKYQFSFLPISKRIEEIYDEFFYRGMKLKDLASKPMLVIGSTNLQTARPFSFAKDFMGDSTYTYQQTPVRFRQSEFPLARAVMASSCVPFAFTPVTIAPEFFIEPAQADLVHPSLVDGGVYDNQGIHKVMQGGHYACDTVVTSDAGSGSSGELRFRNTFALLLETVNVFMSRIKKAQMARDIYENAANYHKEVAYLSLGWDTENCIPGFVNNLEKKLVTGAVISAHHLLPEWINDPAAHRQAIIQHLEKRTGYQQIDKPTAEEKRVARKVSTNLKGLSKNQVDCLIKQAMALTEIQVKLYCLSLINGHE